MRAADDCARSSLRSPHEDVCELRVRCSECRQRVEVISHALLDELVLEILLRLLGCQEVAVSLDTLVRDVVDRVIETVDQAGC